MRRIPCEFRGARDPYRALSMARQCDRECGLREAGKCSRAVRGPTPLRTVELGAKEEEEEEQRGARAPARKAVKGRSSLPRSKEVKRERWTNAGEADPS